jgi:hypothetical protein
MPRLTASVGQTREIGSPGAMVTRSRVRLASVVFTFAPLCFALVASTVAASIRDLAPPMSPQLASRLFPFLAVPFLVLPFVLEQAFHRSPTRAGGQSGDPDQHSLLMGVMSPCAVASLSLILVIVAGQSPRQVYAYAGLSFAVAVYWCWRYRRILT